jgi:capsular polysaccharide export protein
VLKINFNGGDFFYYPNRCENYRDLIAEWPTFLADFLIEFEIDQIILFGDCRVYHRQAIAVAKLKKVPVFIFEEGYFRPNYITFEKGGVNENSEVSRNSHDYESIEAYPQPCTPTPVGKFFWHAAFYAFFYYLLSTILWLIFNNYQHHRNLKITELFYWIRSLYRKIYFKFIERKFMKEVVEANSGSLFVVPLQVNLDSQILFHSKYTSTKDFIDQTVRSFKAFAPSDCKIIFKQHPLDRGYHNYSAYIHSLSTKHDLNGRLFYSVESALPDLFKHALGCVVINSTSGLTAIEKGIPTKVCGKAIYLVDRLTYMDSINSFWRNARLFEVDMLLHSKYKRYLINQTQINGNFYRRIKSSPLNSGLLLGD